MKKILTLDDLVNFCATHNMQRFSSEESGYKILVRVPSTFEEDENNSNDSMLYAKIKLLHTNRNRNGSNVTEAAAKKCMDTIKYKPLLAAFCDIDGEKDFTTHEMEFTEDGIEYIEKQVGCFTADKPSLEYDKEKDRYYLYANAAIPREYTPAADIIERKNGTKVSAELFVNDMSFDTKSKELILNDIEIMGCTLLGKNPDTGEDIVEGMEGARLDIKDFSHELKYEQNDKLVELLEELSTKIDNISNFNIKDDNPIKNSEKGGNNEVKFEELLEKYGKTAEDVTFDYSEMSDDELELAFKELFDLVDPGNDPSEEQQEVSEPTDEEIAGAVATAISALTDSSEPSAVEEARAGYDALTDGQKELISSEVLELLTAQEERVAQGLSEDDNHPKMSVEMSIKMSASEEDDVKRYSVSLSDKIYALQTLVNDTYSESDNDWYYVDVFEEEKYVVMHGWTKNYRQSFKVRNDVYSLVGDRVEVFAQYLTQDEIKKMDEMRSNYSSISDKLSKYESEPEKMEILESDDYKAIYNTAEYEALLEKDAHFDLTTEEVRAKADEILLSYAKAGNLNFSAEEDKKVGKKTFAKKNKSGRYGSIFAK